MFSFHKPRVYRSTEGCCICRAKSSSSRFTDSRKYESDLMKCFDLEYQRSGEICNACVLLVKRYKALPLASSRHWGHVVDARAGPGTKSLSKYKKYKEECVEQGSNGAGSSASARQSQNGKSLIPEKFSKIFKKTKKSQSPTTTITSTFKVKKEKISRQSASVAPSWETNHSLPTTPDSLDSDYEDNRTNSPALSAGATVVQFQTQTRASSYRSRNNATTTTTVGVSGGVANRKISQKLGSKRRKAVAPRKNRREVDNEAFFDENEWQERKSCCGMVHECAALSGALIINLEHYKPCAEHQHKRQKQSAPLQQLQKTIIATVPAVVQLAPPAAPVLNTNSTPVLKKHHLFFKRQSECFPQGDANFINNGSSGSSGSNPTTILNHNHNPAMESFSTANISASPSSSSAASSSPYMPRHSTAKITTILPSSTPTQTPTTYNKAHNFLHKIKSDTGKIVKNSLDKINMAVRIKPSELQEMKQVIKTADKSYVLAKPPMAVVTGHQQQHASYHHVVGLATAGTSPNSTSSLSSSTSSSAPKFSDNSSDSGFDENMLDRKSASPLQEDTDRKMLSRPGVHTLILASGVQVQGQQQNLVLAGNEAAAKILQNRRQQAANMMQQQHLNNRSMASAATTAVKITPIGAGSHNKMRAIYNNNTIQHENGVTTIVPASSFAATSQTAAMNALAPSTVTITPAAAHFAAAANKKLSIGSSNIHNPSNISSNNSNIGAHFNHGHNVSSLNQKIILVKTATKYNSSNSGLAATSSLMPPATTTAKHGHHSLGKN